VLFTFSERQLSRVFSFGELASYLRIEERGELEPG
jgi:hypothetical protein